MPNKAPSTANLKETCRTLMLYSAAWVAAGCAGVQVRPPPAECPKEARRAMRELGWYVGMGGGPLVVWDRTHDDYGTSEVVVPVGPIVSRMIKATGKAPEGTLLYGRLWVDEKKQAVWGRWTEAELPGGRKVPVCVEMSTGKPYPLGGGFAELPQPGTVRLPRIKSLVPAMGGWLDAEKWEPDEDWPHG
jgi:serine/threonine-protein kinase